MVLLSDALRDTPRAIVDVRRLVWAGPLTTLVSVTAVLAVRLVAVVWLRPNPASVVLGWTAPTVDTVLLVSFAVLTFAAITLTSDEPVRTFRRVAAGALGASFIPIVVMSRNLPDINGDPHVMLALAAMHVAAYLPCVTLLPWLTMSRSAGTRS